MLASFQVESLKVSIFKSKIELAQAAANFVAARMRAAMQKKSVAHLILATGASQFEFLERLKAADLDWSKITTFHLDEYKDMSIQHPASFRKYLKERILDEVKPAQAYFLEGDAKDIETEVLRYANLLKQHPIDVACIGIGENGHIAFNDPPVADFADPKLVKVVELDEACRKQQLGEGWFPTLNDVPRYALSLTIPAIMRCKTISCVVPDDRKARAVRDTLFGEISPVCPASILRRHQEAVLWLDERSAGQITEHNINSHVVLLRKDNLVAANNRS
jgi:glucosamine-6-phosphate deaminase